MTTTNYPETFIFPLFPFKSDSPFSIFITVFLYMFPPKVSLVVTIHLSLDDPHPTCPHRSRIILVTLWTAVRRPIVVVLCPTRVAGDLCARLVSRDCRPLLLQYFYQASWVPFPLLRDEANDVSVCFLPHSWRIPPRAPSRCNKGCPSG